MSAGAEHVDEPVVVDADLVIASRPPVLSYGQAPVRVLVGDQAG